MVVKSIFCIVLAFVLFNTILGQKIVQRSDDDLLVATYVVLPRYFAAALATRSQGEVRMAIKISPEGNVTEAKTVAGNEILGGNSIYVLRKWKFNNIRESDHVREAEVIFSYRLIESRDKNNEALCTFSLPFRVDVTEVIPLNRPTITGNTLKRLRKSRH